MYVGSCRRFGHPLKLRDLHHHTVAEVTIIRRTLLGVDQLGKSVGIHRRLRSGSASQHPQARIGRLYDLVQDLPSISLRVLVGVGLVHHDQVKPASGDLVLHHVKSVEIENDELHARGDNLLALGGSAVRHAT